VAGSLTEVALHEAGHCAMARALGRDVLRCAIKDDGSGVTEIAPPTGHRTPQTERRAARQMLLILLAGELAAASCGPVEGWWRL
jgi:hypothetical protein